MLKFLRSGSVIPGSPDAAAAEAAIARLDNEMLLLKLNALPRM
jgi:hypothetical protein